MNAVLTFCPDLLCCRLPIVWAQTENNLSLKSFITRTNVDESSLTFGRVFTWQLYTFFFFFQIWVKVSSMFVRWRRTNCLLRAQSWLHSEGGAEVGQVRGQGLSLHYAIGRLPGNNATGESVWKSVWEEVTRGFDFLHSLCSIVFEQLSRVYLLQCTKTPTHELVFVCVWWWWVGEKEEGMSGRENR